MKKYRLKEEAKQYVFEDLWNEVAPLLDWNNLNMSLKALEEVPQRIELKFREYGSDYLKIDFGCFENRDNDTFSIQQKDLCEKALNGELIDGKDFVNYITNKYGGDTKQFLEEYLKEKK